MTARKLGAALVAAWMLAGCAASPSSTAPAASGDAARTEEPSMDGGGGTGSVAVVRLPQAIPVERSDAALVAAFDPIAAAALATSLPTDLDWTSVGVVCVYLGERAEGGWGLAIQSASLVDGELRILARETRPVPGVVRPGPEYPADCATIDRGALPPGALSARADDTVSDEFIVSGVIEVPEP